MPKQPQTDQSGELSPEEVAALEGIVKRAATIQADLLSRELSKDDLLSRSAFAEALVEVLAAENAELRAWFKDQALLLQKMMLHPLETDERKIKELLAKGMTIGQHNRKISDVLFGAELEKENRVRPLNEGRKRGAKTMKEQGEIMRRNIAQLNADLLKQTDAKWKDKDERAEYIAQKVGRSKGHVSKLIGTPRKSKKTKLA